MVQVLFGDEAAHAEDVFPLFDARFFEIFRKIGDLGSRNPVVDQVTLFAVVFAVQNVVYDV